MVLSAYNRHLFRRFNYGYRFVAELLYAISYDKVTVEIHAIGRSLLIGHKLCYIFITQNHKSELSLQTGQTRTIHDYTKHFGY